MAIENATLFAKLPGFETTKFGFLYLHGRSNHVQFDNKEVESKLGSFVDKQGYPNPITSYPSEMPSPQPSMYDQSSSQNESQPQNTTDYQTLTQFVAKYQYSPQANESTPRSSDLRDVFQGQNLSQPQDIPQEYNQSASWQSNSTDFKPSPQNSGNSNTSPTQELSQDSPASSLQEHETSQEDVVLTNTTQYNATQQAEYSQDYQQQEPREYSQGYQQQEPREYSQGYQQQEPREYSQGYQQQEPREYSQGYQQEEPRESTTAQQTSFENSTSTIPYQNPLAPQQSFDQTTNQNTAEANATQQQNYYSPVYQQQDYYNSVYQQQQEEPSENTTPLQSVFENSTANDPKFTSEQPKYAEQQQNSQLQQEQTQQNITGAQQNSSFNSSETLQEQSNSFRQEQNQIQGNYEERYLQENINESTSRDQQLQQNSFKNLTTPQLIQSAGEEKLVQGSEKWTNESSVENATNSGQPEQERSFNLNQTEEHSNNTDEQFQKQLLFSEERNKQSIPHEYTTNTKQNLFQIEKDPHIIQSLLYGDLSQLRNEYELTAQKVKAATTDATTPSTQAGYQQTYSRFRRENKGTVKYVFKRTDVQQNVQNKQAKRVLGKQLQKLLEKNEVKTNLHTNRLKRMINKVRAHDEPHSKPSIFDKLLNNPSDTNFLMLPSTEAKYKHSKRSPEHGLLMKLEAMRHTFLEKHNECPIFAIFGTSSESCYTLTTDKDNCAEEFMEVKEMFKQSCAETQFYIYVREDGAGKVREDDVQSLTKNGINVLIPE
ncbi:Hypothetical predicted protein [Paramuricea clavata]|uniref:Uncharacterized protein n=1 Tax=Paramuricea clavata TaxID=317549 RepID=A0A7D9HCK2_PARCT|nr:Hypothetical predicted protein [Paramuricea clavata]